MPDGHEKEKLQELYADEIERYKKAKSVMYGYKVTTPEEITDFRWRYASIQENIPRMQDDYERAKKDYSRLKKVQYNLTLAQKEQYCYGPVYSKEDVDAFIAEQGRKFDEGKTTEKEV